jgi:hypothetical protein
MAVFSGAPAATTPIIGSASINQVRVAPVSAASAGMMSVLPVQLSASLLGVMPAKFSGEGEGWPEWKRRWLSFLENVEEAMPAITDTQMLTIFKGLLDDASVHKLEAEQMVDPDVGYEEFLATLDLEFGGDNVAGLRAKWYGLRLRHQGSVRLSDWRSFSSLFHKLRVMVGDATEEEAERLLLRALPVEWRKKVEIEVDKRNREGTLPTSLDERQVVAFLAVETGHSPKSIEAMSPGKWKIRSVDELQRTSIMQLNRQRLDNGNRVTVRQVEERLKVKDVDALMWRWLRVEERVSSGSRSDRNDGFKRDEDRRQRFTREVSAESKSEEQNDVGQVVARVDASKAPAHSAEAHPNKGKGNDSANHPPKRPSKDNGVAPEASQPPSSGNQGNGPPDGVPGAAASPPLQHHLSPHQQHMGATSLCLYPPHPMCWDPSWGAAFCPGQYGQGSGKGSDGKGVKGGKGNAEHQSPGKGSGGKGKGKGSEGKGKGGRGHP